MKLTVALLATGLLGLASTAFAQYQQDPNAQYQQDPNAQYQQDPNAQYQQDPNVQYQQDPNAQVEVDSNAMQYGYVGPHPEPYDYGNAPCYQTGVHFHPYPPFDQYLFRQSNGYFYFIGDMGDFGYNQQLWGYQGNHPIPLEYGGGYCFMEWPHRHHYAPPATMQFRFVGGYYSYFGPWDAVYWANRAAWVGYYNGYYRTSYYGGRYWTVRPAPIYRHTYGWGAPGVYRPGVVVRAPGGGSIRVVAPRVNVYGAHPGYYGHPGGYVAPAHPVYVAPARPGYVAPAHPVYVAPAHPGYVAPPRPAYVAPQVHVAPPAPAAPVRRSAPAPAPAPQRRHF